MEKLKHSIKIASYSRGFKLQMGTYFYKLMNYIDLVAFFDGGWSVRYLSILLMSYLLSIKFPQSIAHVILDTKNDIYITTNVVNHTLISSFLLGLSPYLS